MENKLESNLEIPCIEDKCLLLPICKDKENIECSKLASYIAMFTFCSNIDYKKYYDNLKQVLPYIHSCVTDDGESFRELACKNQY